MPLVIFTGGEPTIQLFKLKDLIKKKLENTLISVETNGSKDCDVLKMLVEHKNGHVVCSPKPYRQDIKKPKKGVSLKLKRTNDLKIIVKEDSFERIDWNIQYDNLFFQPIDRGNNGVQALNNTIRAAREFGARISIQTHKFLGLR